MQKTLLSRLTGSPVFFGLAAGLLAVAAQLAFMPGRDAYGICTICHTRDLMAWLTRRITAWDPGGAVSYLAWPAFTTVGLALGSFLAAWRHGEFRPLPARRRFRMLLLGFLVAAAGLTVMSCPTRLFLRFAYSDTYALFALAGLLGGIFAATSWLRRG